VSTAVTRARRVRLDQLLVERGLAETRARAQALALAGQVRVGSGDAGRTDRKPGDLVDAASVVELLARDPYVSRGGYKLAAALDAFAIDPAGLVCLDVGASTGGFTDVLLQSGALRVYALDVGRGQLADSLRRNPRVVSMGRTNARSIGPETLPEAVALAVVDVAFISLRLVLGPIASAFGAPGGTIVALVKPQFEAGRRAVRGGVVRDPALHLEVLEAVAAHSLRTGLVPSDVVPSPIRGPEGNREFHLRIDVPPDGPRRIHAGAGPDAAARSPAAGSAAPVTGGVLPSELAARFRALTTEAGG
jgi:23S rRNA (cytidine1920-2'-O)/16S rRNA (cytidine1409-2'-O)-methyltransferase